MVLLAAPVRAQSMLFPTNQVSAQNSVEEKTHASSAMHHGHASNVVMEKMAHSADSSCVEMSDCESMLDDSSNMHCHQHDGGASCCMKPGCSAMSLLLAATWQPLTRHSQTLPVIETNPAPYHFQEPHFRPPIA